jgi:hypothetical protein
MRLVRTAIEHVDRELKAAIARQHDVSANALFKLLLLLTGAWAECRLRKLSYEPNGFSDDDRLKIQAEGSQVDRWKKAVELGFRKRYAISAHDLETALAFTPRIRLQVINRSLEEELKPLIEMRNTLAHGQWERPLTNDELSVNQQMCQHLAVENCLSAGFKLKIIEVLSAAIHDLVAGNHAFERDFDQHFALLEHARRNLKTRNFEKWKAGMLAKHQRGLDLRADNFRQKKPGAFFRKIRGTLGI